MKRSLVSGLGIVLCLPAFAGARLPAVNVSAAAVSARGAFGSPVTNVVPRQDVATQNNQKKVSERRVVSRTAANTKNTVAKTASVTPAKDTGERIAANSEFLIPNRPSPDLWAKKDTPLRMPRADEFSVISSNDLLPEENIGINNSVTYKSDFANVETDSIDKIAATTSNLDAQIERLIDLQRRAEENVSRRATNITSWHAPVDIVESAPEPMRAEPKSYLQDDGVKLSRVNVSRGDLLGGDVVSRAVIKENGNKIQDVRDDMTKMSPSELRRAFRKTFLSENKHLSMYRVDERFDEASDIGTFAEGFTSERDLSESFDKIRKLEIKIKFLNSDSALSRDNYNLLSEFAGTVVANPKRAIQVAIPVNATRTGEARKLVARRLAIIEQVLRDTGVAEQRIVPVLSERDEEGFVLRVISNEQYEVLNKQKRNIFGDTVGSKTYKNMSW